MNCAEIKLEDKVIIEIEKTKFFYMCTVNRTNCKPIMKEDVVAYSKFVALKNTKPTSLKLAILSSLLWLKQNSNIPVEMFNVTTAK